MQLNYLTKFIWQVDFSIEQKKPIKICQININYRMIDFSDVGQLNADLSDNFTVWSDLMLTCQIFMTTSYLFTCHILKILQVDITIWQVVAELHHHIFVMGTFELNFLMFLFVKVFSDFWLYICLFHDQLENSTKVSKWKIDEIHPCIWWCFSVGVSRELTWPITNPLCTKLFYKRIWVQWNWLFTEFNERNTSIQRSIKFNIMSKTWKYERLSILFKSN